MKTATKIGVLTLTLVLGIVAPLVAQGDDDSKDWPKEVEAMGASITMYQPQIDSWEGNTFEARAAVSVVKSADSAPVFGAVWLTGHFNTDKVERIVSFYDVTVPTVRFPNEAVEHEQKLIEILEDELDEWVYEVDLDVLLPSLELAQRDTVGKSELKHDVPKIIVTHQPAVLILIDGEPKLQKIEDSKLERVVNTPYVLIKDGRHYYLASDTQWFTAKDVMGPWEATSKLPKEIATIDSQMKEQREDQPKPDDSTAPQDTRIPEIVISTEPAELIFVDGKTAMEPIQGNDILEVSNTDSDVIFDINTQNFFVLLSGRWFRSTDLDNGPWEWVANDGVPLSFSDIPSDSDVGYLRASVAGTDESKDALLEQSIPQTAGVKRGNADSSVEYDGEPKFESVEGTTMTYAVNTSSSVFLVGKFYYWCEQGVWYVSPAATGPWLVCDEIPDTIYTIPPSNPHYNVTYVKVYQSTPEVVYVGYTPGYTGSYVSHSCVVYGTGYYYRPWYTPYRYYARPSTWGFHVRWNPWYGWGFGLSYSTGPFHFSIGRGGYGGRYGGAWFGPGFYRPYPMPYGAGYRAGYRAGYYHGRHSSGRPVHYGGGNTININNNIYGRPANRDRVATTRDRSTGQRPAVARDKANNVFTDRQGNVYKRNDNGSWDRRDKGGWQPTNGTPSAGDRTRPSTRPSQPSARPSQPSTRPTTRPTTPSARPTTPSTRPTSPTTRPSTPSTRPSTRPSTPSARPSTRPSTGSSRPSTRPSSGSLNNDYRARQRGSARSTPSRSTPSRSMQRSSGARRR